MALPIAGIVAAWTSFWKAIPRIIEFVRDWFQAAREARADRRLGEKDARVRDAVARAQRVRNDDVAQRIGSVDGQAGLRASGEIKPGVGNGRARNDQSIGTQIGEGTIV